MNELRIVYPYKGLLLNHEKEGARGSYNSRDEPKNYAA